MKYLVMECHPGYAILLDEEGRFRKAANFRYEVGRTVTDPVLMKEEPERKRTRVRAMKTGLAAAAACFVLVFGVQFYENFLKPYSFIYLTINPEIEMDLNRHGKVVKLIGINEDGEKLLEGYSGRGKDEVTVADDLIDRAIELGFLSEGGEISFSIDSPEDSLFRQYGTDLRNGVSEHLDGKIDVLLQIFNYEEEQKMKEAKAKEKAAASEMKTSAAPAVTAPVPSTTVTPSAPVQTSKPAPAPSASDYSSGNSGYSSGSSGYGDNDNDDDDD